MKMIYHQWFVCLLILLFVGCDSEKKSVKDDPSNQRATFVNKTTKKERDAASARRASSLRASKVKEDPGKMLSLKSLDKWKDLPEEVRSRLYQRKTKGKTEISEKEFEELRAKYDLQFAIEKRQKESWQPVLSKSEPHQGRYEYATEPVAADAEAFHLVGVDAFMKRDIKGVSSEEKKTVEKMIRDVYSSRTRKVGPKFWEEISGKFVRLMYKVPAFRTEPMVQYCAGWANQEVKRFDYSDGYFNTAALNLPGTDYPARFAVNVHAARVKSQQFRLADKEPGIRLAEYYLAVVYWLENDFRASAQDHRLAYEMVNRFITTCESNGKWDLLTQFMKDISKQNHLPVWLKAMCRGRISSELAWRWRGNGYASTVSEDSWKPFEQYQKIAAEEFEKAHKANPLFPESAANLIGISMTGHNDKPEQYWFDKAIEGQVDYMSAYRSRLLSMLPQWGGSVQEMYDFAKLHADKEQYDTNVPMVLVQFHYTTIRYVAGDEKDEILKKPAVVKATIKAIEGVMGSRSSRPNGAGLLDDNYYLTLKAIFATEGKMFDVARESFELIGDDFHQSALEDLRMYAIELVRGKAYLMSGEHADECKELYDLLAAAGPDAEKTDDQKSEIVDRCTALMEKIDEPHALNWLQTVRDKFQFENEFALGMDASLAFDEGLSFWVLGDRSQFKSESRNSVLIDSTDSTKRMTMTSLLNAAGDSKVIEFDIALEKEPKKRGFAAQGLSRHFTPSVSVMNYRGAPFAFGLNRLYRIHKTKPENVFELGQFSFGWKDGQNGLYYYKTAINLDTNRIRLKIAPGYFEAYMNDRFICRSASKQIRGALQAFEICQPLGRKGRGIAQISGVRIGSWYSEVPPIKEGAGKLVEHYQQDFEEDPTDKWAAYWYGQAKHMAGDTEEAIELYMTSIDNGMDEHVPAFFLGDCHDRQGDAKEAIRWYKIAADSKLEDITQMHNRTSSQNYSNSCHWAASRLAWLKHSSPDDSIRSAIEGGEFCKTGSEDKHLWVNQLFTGMEYAKAGDFDKANRTGKSLASKCSPKDKKVLNTVLDAWKAGDEYRWGAEDVPLYLELDDPIPFFRCFEDYLDPSWKGVY